MAAATRILIGVDDTDNETSRGTGWLARQLSAECCTRGLKPISVTRHQFPLDPRIAYTSHNSGACVAVGCPAGGAEAAEFAFNFIAERSAEGSDPGVCVLRADAVSPAITAFALRATAEVVEMSEALALAEAEGVRLRPLGGTGLGVIGALASAGLRAGGSNGRFIDLPGLRQLPDRAGADELERIGIRPDHVGPGPDAADAVYETLGWVRPDLTGGQPVWRVKWSDEYNAWIPIDQKRSRPL